MQYKQWRYKRCASGTVSAPKRISFVHIGYEAQDQPQRRTRVGLPAWQRRQRQRRPHEDSRQRPLGRSFSTEGRCFANAPAYYADTLSYFPPPNAVTRQHSKWGGCHASTLPASASSGAGEGSGGGSRVDGAYDV